MDDILELVPRMNLPVGDSFQELGLRLPTVVINLAHRTDRWQVLCRRMHAAGLSNLVRAPAIEGAKLPTAQIAKLLGGSSAQIDEPPANHLTLTRPAIGCFLSHLAIWRWVAETNLPRVLVLEDDAAPSRSYSAVDFREMVTSLSSQDGLVFPGQIIMGGLAEGHRLSNLARLFYFNGTFSYLITPTACRFLLNHLIPLQSHIDHQMSRVFLEQRKSFAAYYTDPQFFEPDWSLRSDCYVPLSDETLADQELGQLIGATRSMLAEEGRTLLATG